MKTSAGDLLEAVAVLARLARAEDFGAGDLTGDLIDPDEVGRFALVAREPGILAGRAVASAILSVYGDDLEIEWTENAVDGTKIEAVPTSIAVVRGSIPVVLAAERVLLNFLQRLCGVATLTRQFVDAVTGTVAAVYDTRKTIPGWRLLDKYAVRCGGGQNHRMGLYDAVLIKDNHLAGVPTARLAAHVFELLNRISEAQRRPSFIEVEADTPEQLRALLDVVGIDVILCDNFNTTELREAVSMRDGRNLKDRLALEASGGITLETVREVAATGVDRISVGQITHSAPAVDLALDRL